LLSLHRAGRPGVRDVDVDVDAHGRQVFLHVGHDFGQGHLGVANVDRLLVVVAAGQHGEFAPVHRFVGQATRRHVREHLMDGGAIVILGIGEVTLEFGVGRLEH